MPRLSKPLLESAGSVLTKVAHGGFMDDISREHFRMLPTKSRRGLAAMMRDNPKLRAKTRYFTYDSSLFGKEVQAIDSIKDVNFPTQSGSHFFVDNQTVNIEIDLNQIQKRRVVEPVNIIHGVDLDPVAQIPMHEGGHAIDFFEFMDRIGEGEITQGVKAAWKMQKSAPGITDMRRMMAFRQYELNLESGKYFSERLADDVAANIDYHFRPVEFSADQNALKYKQYALRQQGTTGGKAVTNNTGTIRPTRGTRDVSATSLQHVEPPTKEAWNPGNISTAGKRATTGGIEIQASATLEKVNMLRETESYAKMNVVDTGLKKFNDIDRDQFMSRIVR